MPILSTRVQAEARDPEGNLVSIPPSMALQQTGPRVQVTLSPLEDQIRLISDGGGVVPPPVSGYGLIDTGASVTCIDQEAATRAGLAIVDSGPMHSATHANEIVPIYAGRLNIQGLAGNIDSKRAFGANLASQELIILVGRDVLASCIFVYNGVDSSFSISL